MMMVINFSHDQNFLETKFWCLNQGLIGKISQNSKITSQITLYVENEAWLRNIIFSECFFGHVE